MLTGITTSYFRKPSYALIAAFVFWCLIPIGPIGANAENGHRDAERERSNAGLLPQTPETGQLPNTSALDNRISELGARLSNIETDVYKYKEVNDSRSTTHFIQLVIFGIGAFAVAITIATFIGNIWIKDRVNVLHDEAISQRKTQLADMTKATRANIGANIYATIAGQCIDLYKNIPKPSKGGAHHDLYIGHVNMAVTIAGVGYLYSKALKEYLGKQKEGDLTVDEKTQFEELIYTSLNNYVFYLSQRGTPTDMKIVGNVFPELMRIANKKEVNAENKWWYYKETVYWAKLHLRRTTAQETRDDVQRLLDNPDIDIEWKEDTKAHYDLHNKLCDRDIDKVILTTAQNPTRHNMPAGA